MSRKQFQNDLAEARKVEELVRDVLDALTYEYNFFCVGD